MASELVGFRRTLSGLALLSLLVNFGVQWSGPHTVPFSSEATHVSRALQEGRGFADPFLTGPSGPTAQMAPLYPFLHAGLCLVFGTGMLGWVAIIAITALAWAIQWGYVYRFASAYYEATPGLFAAVIGVLLPLPGRMYKWESVFTGAALAISAWLLSRIIAGDSNPWTMTKFGTSLAAGALLCPSEVLIWPVWVWLLAKRLGIGRAARIAVVSGTVTALPLLIWTGRNYIVFHHIFFLRDDVSHFASANNDCAKTLMSENRLSGCFGRYHPSANEALLPKVQEGGEIGFESAEMRETLFWVRSHPARFGLLTLKRAAFFWFPIEKVDRFTLINGVLISAFTIVSLLGALWAASDGFWILIGGMVPFSLIYYIGQIEQRYRYPILWMSVLLAFVGAKLLIVHVKQDSTAETQSHGGNFIDSPAQSPPKLPRSYVS